MVKIRSAIFVVVQAASPGERGHVDLSE